MEISPSPSLKNIPNDVIFEIFSWAPANSLLRFRWTCKYWFNLIRDSKLAKMHLLHQYSITINDNADQFINNTSLLITPIRRRSPPMYTMSFRDVFNQSFSFKEIKLDYYNLFPISESSTTHKDLIFRGCCKGLIYFILPSGYRNRKVYVHFIWNPSTGEFKELPDQSNISLYNARISIDGFGFDRNKDDYKIVRVAYYDQDSMLSREINVYTLASNSWSKKVENTDYCYNSSVLRSCSGLFVNGALHWMMKIMRTSTRPRGLVNIICFDIEKEEHGEMELPDNLANIWWSTSESDLRVLNECLCIFHINNESYSKKMDVWMMKDYGTKDSWTKLFAINMKQLLKDISQPSMIKLYPALKLLKYDKEGEFLIVFNGKYIIVYDLMRETRRKIIRYDVHKIEDDDEFEDVCAKAIYIENLVSLNSGKYLTVAGSRTTTLRKYMRNEEHHWKKQSSVTSTQHEHKRDAEDQRNKIKKQKI